MDLGSLSVGEKIGAASGAGLLLFLFPSWIEGQSAWELFGIVHILLAILALTALGLPLAKAAGYKHQLRPSDRAILTRVGTVALVFVLAYFLEALGKAQIGLWVAALAAAGIFVGGALTPSPEAPSWRRDRTRRPPADEGFEERPPGMESWRRGAPLEDDEDGAEEPDSHGDEADGGRADWRDAEPSRGEEVGDRPGRAFAEPAPQFEVTERREPRRRSPEDSAEGDR